MSHLVMVLAALLVEGKQLALLETRGGLQPGELFLRSRSLE